MVPTLTSNSSLIPTHSKITFRNSPSRPIKCNSSAPGFSFGSPRRKDSSTVFVAGATGQAGIRIAQTLLREGFSVRAGVPQLASAQELARLAAQYKIISNEEAKRLNAVQSSFDDADSIAKAIGNASKVVVTIGPTEDGPTTEVSTADALQVIQAAQLAGVGHVAVIYDESVSASTNNVLDDVKYTLIKTSLTDDFAPESSYNLVVSGEESTRSNDYKVSKSKIASLVADVFSNTQVAENKVVQVYTDPNAPLKRVDELFSTIPEDGRRKAYAEVLEKAKAEEGARAAAETAKTPSKPEAPEKAEVAGNGAAVEDILSKAKDFGAGFSWQKFSSKVATSIQKPDENEKPKVQVATVRGQAKARSLIPKLAVTKQTSPKNSVSKPKEEKRKAEAPKELRKVFGGLFKQETIYIDDD
ncbi:unnamed protein product [Vicia faba]|uniref:NmrA-like domain-containing protein n=1 Tax=Vicia faba TaxID=3906 RepID=A0AAV1B3B8_VICFA|nr:unnamed protein product [Vicia faba]